MSAGIYLLIVTSDMNGWMDGQISCDVVLLIAESGVDSYVVFVFRK